MIKTILVDDDLLHLESLQNMLNEHFKQVEIIATSTTVPDAAQKIEGLKPELVFLDIEMSPFSGFDLLEMVDERNFEVIFTTNYQKYAIQAIKASALDYIEKPIDKEKLAEALQRYRDKTGQVRINNLLENFRLPPQAQRIAFPDRNGMHFFEAGKIIHCQTDNSYTHFLIKETGTDKTFNFTVSKGLAYLEDFLVEKGLFFKVHQQHLININYIKRFIKGENAYLVIDHLKETIPVARNRKDEFIRFLKAKGMTL